MSEPATGVDSHPSALVRHGYLLSVCTGILGVVTAVLAFAVLLTSVSATVEGFVRVPAPADTARFLPRGALTIYHEPGVGDDRLTTITVVSPSGRELPVRPYTSSLSYNLGGYSGSAVATLTASEQGAYTVVSDGSGTIAFGPSIARRITLTVFVSLAVGGVLGAVSVVLAITTFIRRRGMRRDRYASLQPPRPTHTATR